MTRIRFEDLPSTNTPINAENLNKLNNVIVSSEEPTTGEEVWIERGKNLINPKTLLNGYDLSDGNVVTSSGWFVTPFIGVEENYSYYMSGFKNGDGNELFYKCFYDKDYTFISVNRDNPTIIPSDTKYVRLCGHIENSSNLLFIQSDVAIDYEPYIDKKIHTKNDNGVYEEFYNGEDIIELQNNVSKLIDKTTLKSATVSAATFFKIGNLVMVQGWFVINGTTAEFTVPYKPSVRTWVSSTGLNTDSAPRFAGMMEIATTGKLTAKYTGASTYGTTGFCYFTND